MKTKFTLLTAVTLAFVAIAAPAAQASTFTPDSQIQYALEHKKMNWEQLPLSAQVF